MATSDSRDFDLDVGEIVEEAYERCGLEVQSQVMMQEQLDVLLTLCFLNGQTEDLIYGQ